MSLFNASGSVIQAQGIIMAIAESLVRSTKTNYELGTLAGCCAFLDSPKTSPDLQIFSDTIVQPIVTKCFDSIGRNEELSTLNPLLKNTLRNQSLSTADYDKVIKALCKKIFFGKMERTALKDTTELRLQIPYVSVCEAALLLEEARFSVPGGQLTHKEGPASITIVPQCGPIMQARFQTQAKVHTITPVFVELGEQNLGSTIAPTTIKILVYGLTPYQPKDATETPEFDVTIPPRSISPLPSVTTISDLGVSPWLTQFSQVTALRLSSFT